MKKHIDEKMLSIPPYVSTGWEHILALTVQGSQLMVTLSEGTVIAIPHLTPEEVEQIFTLHQAFLDKRNHPKTSSPFPFMGEGMESSFKLFMGKDGLNSALQHNPEQAHLPPLPQEILDKIRFISRMMPAEELKLLSPAESSCNCVYCQVTRALQGSAPISPPLEEEEIISDEELSFSEWDIQPVGEKLFQVTNKLDPSEQYKVFLGDPVGCTCGKPHCPHIVAVLKS